MLTAIIEKSDAVASKVSAQYMYEYIVISQQIEKNVESQQTKAKKYWNEKRNQQIVRFSDSIIIPAYIYSVTSGIAFVDTRLLPCSEYVVVVIYGLDALNNVYSQRNEQLEI